MRDLSRFAVEGVVTHANQDLTKFVVDNLHRYAAQLRFNLGGDDDTDTDLLFDASMVAVSVDGQSLHFEPYRLVCERDKVTALILQNISTGLTPSLFVAFRNSHGPRPSSFLREYGAQWTPASKVVAFDTEDITGDTDWRDVFFKLPDSKKLKLFGL